MPLLRNHIEEASGSIFAMIAAASLSETLFVVALSALVGGVVGFVVKKIMEVLWPEITNLIKKWKKKKRV